MCNTHCSELGDKELLATRQSISFGGIVTAVRTGISKRGTPFGIVTMEDYEGSGEIAIFDDWVQWSNYFFEGSTIFVKATNKPRYANSTYYQFKIGSIELLPNVREKGLERFTITIKDGTLTPELVKELKEKANQSPGDVPMFIEYYDRKNNLNFNMRSRNTTIAPTRNLIEFLDSIEEVEYFVN